MRKKKSRKKVRKKTSKISFKKIKSIKITKELKQFKDLSLLLKREKNKIINKQKKLLKGISLHRLADYTSRSLNKTYENFKKKQETNKLKKIKLEKRKEARRIIKEKKEQKLKTKHIKKEQQKQKRLDRINEKIILK